MVIPYFDLHCDTAYEMYVQNQPFQSNTLHLSGERVRDLYYPYRQVFAIWSDKKLTPDEQYEQYGRILSCFRQQMHPCRTILAVEGASMLNGDITRLDRLYRDGVRILTLAWSGSDCIGGAWDSDTPLTDFGIDVVRRCGELGIIVDLSHCGDIMMSQVLDISRRPVIASHSNSRAVTPHKRNLTDEQFRRITGCGGLAGISLHSAHLLCGGTALDSFRRHLEHYLSICGIDTVACGFDLDGCDLPGDVTGVEFASQLYDYLLDMRYSKDLLYKVFFGNAFNFFGKML